MNDHDQTFDLTDPLAWSEFLSLASSSCPSGKFAPREDRGLPGLSAKLGRNCVYFSPDALRDFETFVASKGIKPEAMHVRLSDFQ